MSARTISALVICVKHCSGLAMRAPGIAESQNEGTAQTVLAMRVLGIACRYVVYANPPGAYR